MLPTCHLGPGARRSCIRIHRHELETLVWFSERALRDGAVSADEKRVHDLVPELASHDGWISDEVEGLAVTRDGSAFLVTDNDGVDGWSGETTFLSLGRLPRPF